MSPLRIVLAALIVTEWTAFSASVLPLEFNRDIRPILSENCFLCHGQDPKHREADLRLDSFEEATRDLGGYAAIVPGHPENSELLARLETSEKDEVMPPPKSNRHVSKEQIAVLRRWISAGAKYQRHWAYEPPRKTEVPPVDSDRPLHPIDAFVRAKLTQEGLSPSPEAAPETWLRRASLDLTGLPPTLPELDQFQKAVKERGEGAFGEAADRLLASPHFGERLAIDWLDIARYADTHGFNNDSARVMWRWREWVIESFNANLPYDQFITQQLAGDLIPDATVEQRLATGFCRNHVINSEGGIIDEEYRVEYVADRVRTLSTAWLGLTFECAKCHDHKFDPITQRDYYQLFAFFNSVPEHGEDGRVANAVPIMAAPNRNQVAALSAKEKEIAGLDARLDASFTPPTGDQADDLIARGREEAAGLDGIIAYGYEPWHSKDYPEAPAKVPDGKISFTSQESFAVAFWVNPDADNPSDVPLLSAINYQGSPADSGYGKGRDIRLIDGEIEFRISDRYPAYATIIRSRTARIQPGQWRHICLTGAKAAHARDLRIFIDGVKMAVEVRYDGLSGLPGDQGITIGAGNLPNGSRFRGQIKDIRGFPRRLNADETHTLSLVQPAERAMREAQLRKTLPDLWQARAKAWDEYLRLQRGLPTTMVMHELPSPRPAHILTRGQYDAPGEAVEPNVPEKLIASWPADTPHNRLGLAKWLTQPNHPLTARVVVNRYWAQLFGTGLVKTVEDFGSQSEWPSHPEVLDWLARDFIESGWDVKRLFRSLVLTATYRQASAVSSALVMRDPENRLLARGPRVRLPAEVIRDQALAISGLLSPRLGGPSVYPYQPEKFYDGVVVGAAYPGTIWTQGSGEDLYRRSLYTFWKRTVPHPAMTTLDAPDREFCTARRSRTNTPLQALLLWNEPGYVEAARHLAGRMIKEGGTDDTSQVIYGFRLATCRAPSAEEVQILSNSLAALRSDFNRNSADADALLKVGASPNDPAIPAIDLAAATGVASMILSLDETITKN